MSKTVKLTPEHRIMTLELKHAAKAIERAWLIANRGRLLEAARATVMLAEEGKA
jgi:hypothetical protein